MENIEIKVRNVLKNISIGSTNVVDSGIVATFMLDASKAILHITPLQYGEEVLDKVLPKVRDALIGLEEVTEVEIKIPEEDNAAGQQGKKSDKPSPNSGYLKEYRHVIAIASGKGGVGKSTVSANLAISLGKLGKTVSLFDGDVYGPSTPLLFGELKTRSEVNDNMIVPINKYGVDFVSMGNLVGESESVIWRGPMVHQAVEQILRDTDWPGGDYMIMDLPPGTGDVQITLSQSVSLSGAVIVCTPQDVALLDARRAIRMFGKVNVPIIGMIENMSTFVCPKCNAESPIFGHGGVRKDCETFGFPLLGNIPIELDIRTCSDHGIPVTEKFPGSESAKYFFKLAEELDSLLEKMEAKQP